MTALRFNSHGDIATVLYVEELPTSVSGPEEILVQVHAASINPGEAKKTIQGRSLHAKGSQLLTEIVSIVDPS